MPRPSDPKVFGFFEITMQNGFRPNRDLCIESAVSYPLQKRAFAGRDILPLRTSCRNSTKVTRDYDKQSCCILGQRRMFMSAALGGFRSSVLSSVRVPNAAENMQGDRDRRFVRMFDCSKSSPRSFAPSVPGDSVVVQHRRPCLVSRRIEGYAGDRVERRAYNGQSNGTCTCERACVPHQSNMMQRQ
jgi:hypothetical protein